MVWLKRRQSLQPIHLLHVPLNLPLPGSSFLTLNSRSVGRVKYNTVTVLMSAAQAYMLLYTFWRLNMMMLVVIWTAMSCSCFRCSFSLIFVLVNDVILCTYSAGLPSCGSQATRVMSFRLVVIFDDWFIAHFPEYVKVGQYLVKLWQTVFQQCDWCSTLVVWMMMNSWWTWRMVPSVITVRSVCVCEWWW